MMLAARWLLPISGSPIPQSYIAIEEGVIRSLGSQATLRQDQRAALLDLGDAVILPGLVNAHTHLELTAYAGELPPMDFWRWLPELVQRRRAPGRVARERDGVRAGAWQSLRSGVTCVGDISRENIGWRELKSLPLRKVCFTELITLADQPPRDPQELHAAVAAVEEDALLTAGVTPHAPYTVSGEHVRASVELAAELGRPWCTHWAETREELAFLAGDANALPRFLRDLLRQCGVRPPGCGAFAHLDHCTAGLPPGLLAHCNYATAADADVIARLGHSVAYCPRAHCYFAHSPHPLAALRAAGVNVCIATDSAASNENLSLLEELRFVRENLQDAPPPAELLKMVTLNAARALRLERTIGSLEPGKTADLVAFPCAAATRDPEAALVDSATHPLGVWVAGERLILSDG